MAIKCGNCKGFHDTVRDVAECHGEFSPPKETPRQRKFIEDLLAQRAVQENLLGSYKKEMSKEAARDLIRWLLDQPKKLLREDALRSGDGIVVKGRVPTPGTYTVVLSDTHRTYRIRKPHPQAEWVGVEYLYGSDNESSFKRFGKVVDGGVQIWNRYGGNTRLMEGLTFLLNLNNEALKEAGYKYALQSGNCYRCGRKLTVPTSIHRGLGPICAGKE